MIPGSEYHRPVMVDEVIGYLLTDRGGTYLDATAGGGSHSFEIIRRLEEHGRLLAIDRDTDAVTETAGRLQQFSSQTNIVQGEFGDLKYQAVESGMAPFCGVLFDLGISSHQIDDSARGMSHREDGPLDFRMDRGTELTGATIINRYPQKELARIFFEYGGERNSRKIAAAIYDHRHKNKYSGTAQLVETIKAVTNPRFLNKTLSRVFQSIRIVVNDEMGQLADGLGAALEVLAPGGRMVVISYHSLEDGLVKNFFRDRKNSELSILTKKPIGPAEAECKINSRARSAKMRVAEKL